MKIVGIDLSLTSTGVAFIDGDIGEISIICHHAIKSDPKKTRFQRATQISEQIIEFISDHHYVFIEDYAYAAGKGNSLAYLGELCGVLKTHLSTEPIPIPITSWKKFLSNKGNLNKDEFKLQIYKTFGLEVHTNDEAAAIGLAFIGKAIMEYITYARSPENNYQMDCISKIIKDPSKELSLHIKNILPG